MQPSTRPLIERLAAALFHQARAHMALALMDGRYWTVNELAQVVGLARSSASEHVDRLHAAGLIRERRQGRHRYVSLDGPETAELIEHMGALAGEHAPAPARPA
ncbi:helix-turn-helix domain-containing protein [Dermacoccus barathri]|uniref:ArsR/SmtB family transcription factor n=1 Tax=Dermacoccus barathri TaxID=322601 RepID=UPI0031F81FCD